MTKKRTIDPTMIDAVAQNMFHVLPLLKKRLMHMDMVQKEHGTPLSHVQVLAMLQDAGTMSVSEISRRLGIAKPNITPLVDRLFEAGYVDRQHDENDRRVVNIVLLPAGCDKLAAIRATIARQIQVQAESLTVSEFRELNDSLSGIVRILSSLSGFEAFPFSGKAFLFYITKQRALFIPLIKKDCRFNLQPDCRYPVSCSSTDGRWARRSPRLPPRSRRSSARQPPATR